MNKFLTVIVGLTILTGCSGKYTASKTITLAEILTSQTPSKVKPLLKLDIGEPGTEAFISIPIEFDEDYQAISSRHHILELTPSMFQQALDKITNVTYAIDTVTNGHSGTTIYVCANEVATCRIEFSCGSHGCGFDIYYY